MGPVEGGGCDVVGGYDLTKLTLMKKMLQSPKSKKLLTMGEEIWRNLGGIQVR